MLNLRAADFEVVESGVVQQIEAAELRTASSNRLGAPTTAIASDADEVRAAREPGTRVIALLLDEFHVSRGESTERVRAALRHFMDELVRPTDLLVVLKPLESVTAIRFTRDHQAVREAIETFEGRKGDYEARTAFERQYLGSAPEAVRAGRAQIVLSGLRALVSKLGDLQAGRSAIVVASEGVGPEVPGRDRDRERRVPAAQGLVRAASRFNVAVYVLDPAPETDDSGKAALQRLASDTGGRVLAEPRPLERLARDMDAYYVLTYTSSHPADGRFYDVTVRTKRADAAVRARSGYWAPLRTALARTVATPSAPPRALRRSAFIDTWVGLTVEETGRQRAVFTWEPAPRAARSPANEAHVVEIKATSRDGELLYEGALVQARGNPGVDTTASAVFEAPTGRLQLDLVILRRDGTRLDTAAQDLDLPDGAKQDPRILPPQVMRAASAREFRALAADPGAAPVPSREFRRTERLLVRVPTWSPSGSEVSLAARLVNRMGQSLRLLQPMTNAPAGLRQYDVPLSWLAPGEYRIELTATTPNASVREAIRFRVTG